MNVKATTADAFRLLMAGSATLAQMEHNGLRVNEDRLDATAKRVAAEVKHLREELRADPVWDLWRREHGDRANLGSIQQLGGLLYGKMGFECTTWTEGGREKNVAKRKPKVDEDALERIDHPFVKKYVRFGKLEDFLAKSLEGLRRELVDGFLHPSFNLHTARSYRSSSGADKEGKNTGQSSSFNIQNVPVRDPVYGKMVRECFVPRPGNRIVERDFKGIEVMVALFYHHDPTMLEYLTDPTKDMHRDMAAKCYKLRKPDVTKDARYCGKNGFVFPAFYGSYYLEIAKNMWAMIEQKKLIVGRTGLPLREHLAAKGIGELGACDPKERPIAGTFEAHVKGVEDWFWDERFPVYKQWKNDWWAAYLKTGGFDMLTGFRVEGIYVKNQVVNYGVQGSAFHCLLWTLNQLQRWLNRNKMKSLLIGQIHDSIIADVTPDELDAFLDEMDRIVAEDLPRHWPWITVPMTVEAEVTPVDGDWHSKAEWIKRDGKWGPAKG